MANNDTTRQAARNALEAYKASPGMVDDDDETSIVDLIADLAFLAEADLEISGEYVIEKGAFHFSCDKDEQEDEHDEDDDVIEGEVVEELDDYREVLQDSGTTLELER